MTKIFECSLKIIGISNQEINNMLTHTLTFFNNEGYDLNNKFKLAKEGEIDIRGVGKDGRCACCEYLRQKLISYYESNELKGSITLIDCPFNLDNELDYTPEGKKKKKIEHEKHEKECDVYSEIYDRIQKGTISKSEIINNEILNDEDKDTLLKEFRDKNNKGQKNKN